MEASMPGLNLLTRRQSELAIDVFRSFDLAGAPTLTKRGKTIHHVVLRVFVLADGFIFYFKSPSATEPSGLIPIQGSEFKMHKYVAGHEKLNMCFELRTPVRAWGSIVLHYHGCTEEKADAVIATLEASGGKRILGDFSEFHDHLEHQAGAQENHHDDVKAKASTSPTLPRYDPHEEAMPALQLLYSTKRGQSQQNLVDLQWSSLREHSSHHHHSDSAGSLKCLAAAIENDNARVEATLDISNELCHDLCTTGEATRSFGHLSLGVHTHSLGRIHHMRSRSSSSSTASYAEGDVRSKRESLVVMSSGVDVKPHDTRVVQAISLAESYSGSFSLRQYTPLKLIGKGGFGQVIVARHNETHNLVAIKTLSKHALTAQNQVAHTKAERNVLIKCYNHPFIVKLHAAFQTIDHLHMVLDYCPGGELFFHLSKVGRFTEPEAAFYASEIFLALDHLHAHAIIYRDLKPENVLLDRDGHVRLADFGLSKEDVSGRKLAATFCGSAEYISPELLALADGADGGGYDKGVDIWALGCLIFELLTGLPPSTAASAGPSSTRGFATATFRFPTI
ncbi:AGC/SGK protein kinase [Saprolegnia parasitica CBS 223.65]|uniref:AGC/SGK protein kinase n=1 Tax=Saprolegnia parasitica (strain CBS 223.65) TaxID=695850 RepID=A0A067CV07_SAPPC|nr:AGC/SGK protein kinase [Saprolegnia parasitica CBS 223.65]KDO34338.1 AGC/SGK protein kinase [Saprolegnia parasitica CBS 223.65]|eukprot:XP_012195074.1 AGC/SGK protein kinase [Saprolegnia parasitica CBS 223.65]